MIHVRSYLISVLATVFWFPSNIEKVSGKKTSNSDPNIWLEKTVMTDWQDDHCVRSQSSSYRRLDPSLIDYVREDSAPPLLQLHIYISISTDFLFWIFFLRNALFLFFDCLKMKSLRTQVKSFPIFPFTWETVPNKKIQSFLQIPQQNKLHECDMFV